MAATHPEPSAFLDENVEAFEECTECRGNGGGTGDDGRLRICGTCHGAGYLPHGCDSEELTDYLDALGGWDGM